MSNFNDLFGDDSITTIIDAISLFVQFTPSEQVPLTGDELEDTYLRTDCQALQALAADADHLRLAEFVRVLLGKAPVHVNLKHGAYTDLSVEVWYKVLSYWTATTVGIYPDGKLYRSGLSGSLETGLERVVDPLINKINQEDYILQWV